MAPALGSVVLVSRMYPNKAKQSKERTSSQVLFISCRLASPRTYTPPQRLVTPLVSVSLALLGLASFLRDNMPKPKIEIMVVSENQRKHARPVSLFSSMTSWRRCGLEW